MSGHQELQQGLVLIRDVEMNDLQHVCGKCWYCYDEAFEGENVEAVPALSFADLPDSWLCPDCGAKKSEFFVVESRE